jgi:hypothetical protein
MSRLLGFAALSSTYDTRRQLKDLRSLEGEMRDTLLALRALLENGIDSTLNRLSVLRSDRVLIMFLLDKSGS